MHNNLPKLASGVYQSFLWYGGVGQGGPWCELEQVKEGSGPDVASGVSSPGWASSDGHVTGAEQSFGECFG